MTVEYAVDYEGHEYLSCELDCDNEASIINEVKQMTDILCDQVFIMACGRSPHALADDDNFQHMKACSTHYTHCAKWLRPTIYLFAFNNDHKLPLAMNAAWLLFDRVKFISGYDISWKNLAEKQAYKQDFYNDVYCDRGYWITCYKGESDYDLNIYSNNLKTIYRKMKRL